MRSLVHPERSSELARLRAWAEEPRSLVTITGIGGIGKTTLMRAFARTLPARRVRCCDLRGARSEADVVREVALALGLEGAGPAAVERGLVALGHTHLCIDDVDLVRDAAAACFTRWLTIAPRLRLVVTARLPLGLREESVLELGPLTLPPPDAAIGSRSAGSALLAAMGRDLATRYLDRDEEEALRVVLTATGGVPLAIHLAAARLATVSAGALAERIEAARGIGGAPTAFGAELAQTFARTLDALSPQARHAFASASVFRASFTAASFAEVVAASDAERPLALEWLESLRSAGLVAREGEPTRGEPRFSVIAPIADLAARELARDSGDAEAVSRRHAAHWARLGPQLARRSERGQGDGARELLDARHDLVSALAFAAHDASLPEEVALGVVAGLEPVVVSVGLDAPVEAAIGQVVSGSRMGGAVHAMALVTWAACARFHGALLEGHERLKRALPLALDAGDTALADKIRRGLALRGYGAISEYAEREAMLIASLEGARARQDRSAEVATLGTFAAFCLEESEIERGIRFAREGLDLGPPDNAWLEAVLATLLIEAGRIDEAEPPLALATARVAAKRQSRYATLIAYLQALLTHEKGELVAALTEFAEVDQRAESLAQIEVQLNANVWSAVIHLSRDDDPAARRSMARARTLSMTRSFGWAHLGALEAVLAAREQRLDDAASALARTREGEPARWPEPRSVLEAADAYVELASSTRAGMDSEQRAALRARAVKRIAALSAVGAGGAPPLTQRSSMLRAVLALTLRLLGDTPIERALRDAPVRSLGDEQLVVSAEGAWFQPLFGDRVEVTAAAHARILAALVSAREAKPGVVCDVESLARAGWPGERPSAASAQNRVRVAIAKLRQAGLRHALMSARAGYALDPAMPLRVVPIE